VRALTDPALLREVFDHLPAMVAHLTGPAHVFTYANPAFLRSTGRRAEDVLGRSVAEVLPEVVSQGYLDVLDGVRATGQRSVAHEAEVALRAVDGRIGPRWFDYIFEPILGPDGTCEAILVQATDVTDKVEGLAEVSRIAAELRQAEALYRGLFETMTQGVVHHAPDGTPLATNPAARRMLGHQDDDGASGRRWEGWRAVRADGTPFPAEELPAMVALRTGQPVEAVEMGVPDADEGTVRWLLVSAVPQLAPDGTVAGAFATFDDITLRRQAEEALQESLRREQENRFRRAIDTMPDAVMIAEPLHDAAGRPVDLVVAYVNEATTEIGGRSPEHLVGRRFTDLWPNIERSGLLSTYLEVLETGEPLVLEPVGYRDEIDGRVAEGVYDIRATKLGDDLFMAWRDVTSRFAEEAALRTGEAALAEAQRIARLGSWRWTQESNRLELSPEGARLCGLPEDGRAFAIAEMATALHPDDRFVVERIVEDVATGTTFEHEARVVHPSEGTLHVVISGEPVLRADATVVAIRGTIQDVTARRTAEQALERSQEQLERERHAVQALQRSILPNQLPLVAGLEVAAEYLPASNHLAVGGDWYDAFVLPDGRVALTVGDVTGKGLEAAETMAQLRNGARMAALLERDPGRVVAALNRFLLGSGSTSLATAVFCTYDPVTGTLTWASAGHLPLLVRRADGTAELLDGGTGPLLGAVDRAYGEAHTTLAPGDGLVLYTDGLVERRTEPLDTGLERLRRAASSSAHAAELCAQVLRSCLDGATLADDTCVLALVRHRIPATTSVT
jgi:PAS domain S-box-containing protein